MENIDEILAYIKEHHIYDAHIQTYARHFGPRDENPLRCLGYTNKGEEMPTLIGSIDLGSDVPFELYLAHYRRRYPQACHIEVHIALDYLR